MKLQSKTSKYSSIFIGLTLLFSPLGVISPHFQNPVLAQNNQINLLSQGKGIFTLGNRKAQNVNSASVTLKGNRANLAIILDNNQTIRFDGTFTRQNSQQVRINLTNSGNADARGDILLEYRNNNITLLNGKGRLDGQNFNLLFRENNSNSNSGGNNNSLNIQQTGEGLLNIQSRQTQNITFVTITVDNRQKARISLGLKNGNVMNFEGKQTQKDAYSIRIQVNNSGMASATGFFNIELGSRNSINNIIGQGTIDGQTFLANFR
ncbi:MAG: hypothetical protein GW795_01695 [Cyanobacteria bacterium]|nr:hypothetical protein [Cyanobacteria bacterium CG_2015-16_32_12]NCO78240.1 hypothetical protein [Cyanobacteria bacterium CG_2015-22_32_23]NCQ03743.1 hypothetical protein [Cyanobacteria bacterium CG_2015-09_32_10]NCQ40616.1 hypothetical protein [Cyanobacteria bacterium CG_2015-04_32_10]NCS85171.1 hypothetical protein [Cyanobacteria bacterium CG_2015-02_32_10]